MPKLVTCTECLYRMQQPFGRYETGPKLPYEQWGHAAIDMVTARGGHAKTILLCEAGDKFSPGFKRRPKPPKARNPITIGRALRGL